MTNELSHISRKRRVRCACDCGRTRDVQVSNLSSGNTTSCGYSPCSTRWESRRYPRPGDQARNFIYLNYQSKARAKNRQWGLTFDDFCRLTSLPCWYCGAEPSNQTRDRNGDGAFVYSGLDRIDPAGGYISDNVVPACIVCNRAKTDMTLEAFERWTLRVASLITERRFRGEPLASRGQ